eukprot:2274872-Rhodomonas_salina.1
MGAAEWLAAEACRGGVQVDLSKNEVAKQHVRWIAGAFLSLERGLFFLFRFCRLAVWLVLRLPRALGACLVLASGAGMGYICRLTSGMVLYKAGSVVYRRGRSEVGYAVVCSIDVGYCWYIGGGGALDNERMFQVQFPEKVRLGPTLSPNVSPTVSPTSLQYRLQYHL